MYHLYICKDVFHGINMESLFMSTYLLPRGILEDALGLICHGRWSDFDPPASLMFADSSQNEIL